jgi:hypothetical protein
VGAALVAFLATGVLADPAAARPRATPSQAPVVGTVAAADLSPPLTEIAVGPPGEPPEDEEGEALETSPVDAGHTADGALDAGPAVSTMPSPLFTFEGPSAFDNVPIFGGTVLPPDPVGDVGRNHYVAMVNLTFAVYSKAGQLLFGPADTGRIWTGFPIEDCTDPSGDPVVLYDELADRWILTQFTTRFDTNQFYNCIAVSATPDPTGAYYRYAVSTGDAFPDYPKYGIWPTADGGSLTITTREFPPDGSERIGVYAVDRKGLLHGSPDTTVLSWFVTGPPNLVGDGLLPADQDGRRRPPRGTPQVILGAQDDDASDGATFDALNVFSLRASFRHPERSTFGLQKQIPIAPVDTIFPCAPGSRNCLPEPNVPLRSWLDFLVRQRPLWRLQYRNQGTFESLVTNESVEARTAQAGVRWFELRNPADPVLHQEGTWAPDDGVHRWLGSVAADQRGNIALGYSVTNGTDVFPGIRYAGRLATDPLGELSQGEAVLQAGSGSQRFFVGRWGDYTSMNVDPVDGCTFYYINEYYTVTAPVAWQTRIGTFRFPSCS